MMGGKRIFLAVPLGLDKYKGIEKVLEKLRKKIGHQARWVKPENLHLTIVFFGNLNLEEFKKIEEVINKVTSLEKAFVLKFNRIEWGPSLESARMIWLRGQFSEGGNSLKKKIIESLEKNGLKINFDSRRLLTHITLARLRGRLKSPPFIREEVNFNLKVESVELWESKLSNKEANYFSLRSFPLRGS